MRRKTRKVRVGGIAIGGSSPVSIQSMTNTETADVKATLSQIRSLEKAGCEIVRVAVKNQDDALAVRQIKRKMKVPLVCDIHFDHRLALKAIESGADKIRLNPGNIRKREDIEAVIRAAKKARIPIRIGVNSGSVMGRAQPVKTEDRRPKTEDREGSATRSLVEAALGYLKLFEGMEFRDIIISLKGSDVASTVEAYRKMSKLCEYPLHLGITASGPYDTGVVKSSIGIGALLLDGMGDTIRVSLTADPIEEVLVAKNILAALHIRRFGPEIISCPTCGRCQVGLIKIVNELKSKLSTMDHGLWTKEPLTIAVMGCEVNGPGEAMVADIGIAFGKGSGVLFKKGKIFKKVAEKDAIRELLKLL